MKKLSIFLALLALIFTELAFGAGALATSITGLVQVQTGSASPRVLRQGDEVQQGDTVMTGTASAAVLKFDDGQIAALTSNSRMTVTAYQYNPQTSGGSILLSLISGGMRAITGLIGKRSPSQVAYRAATATIGIRGTDTTLVVSPKGEVLVTVSSGEISFQVAGQAPIIVKAGEGVDFKPGFAPSKKEIAAIIAALNGTEEGREIASVLRAVDTLGTAIANAFIVAGQAQGETLTDTRQRGTETFTSGGTLGGGGGVSPH